jgi:hypothetical protein
MDVTEAVPAVPDPAAVARRMWVRFETYHDVTYFTPESRAAADALGCKGGWMGYFAMRAAPLGAAPPELVISTFYNFHPTMVRRALPDAWQLAEPVVFLAARLAGVDGALRRMLGDDMIDGPELAEAAELAARAAAAAPIAGRPLAAANSLVSVSETPHLALWQASTVLRESRGDGHVAALVAADLDPCEALVLFGAERGIDPAYLRAARRWSEQEWQAATDRLTGRGLLAADGAITAEGTELRTWIETRTDQAASASWRALGQAGCDRLADLLTPIALRIAESNEAMRTNPMGLDAARELTRSGT